VLPQACRIPVSVLQFVATVKNLPARCIRELSPTVLSNGKPNTAAESKFLAGHEKLENAGDLSGRQNVRV
jgi:hypothetical protein